MVKNELMELARIIFLKITSERLSEKEVALTIGHLRNSLLKSIETDADGRSFVDSNLRVLENGNASIEEICMTVGNIRGFIVGYQVKERELEK